MLPMHISADTDYISLIIQKKHDRCDNTGLANGLLRNANLP